MNELLAWYGYDLATSAAAATAAAIGFSRGTSSTFDGIFAAVPDDRIPVSDDNMNVVEDHRRPGTTAAGGRPATRTSDDRSAVVRHGERRRRVGTRSDDDEEDDDDDDDDDDGDDVDADDGVGRGGGGERMFSNVSRSSTRCSEDELDGDDASNVCTSSDYLTSK